MTKDDDYDQAAEWLEDIDRWTPARRAAFLEWASAAPERWVAAQRIWSVLDDRALTDALAETAMAASPGATDALGEAAASLEAQTVAPPTVAIDTPVARRQWRGAAAAAGVALAASLAVVWLAVPSPSVPTPARNYVTRPGVAATTRLADGSALRLDPDSRIAVTLSRDERQLDLTRGRGLFRVVHDAGRPFTVRAGVVEAVALGTVFSVDRIAGIVEVRVEQGQVRAGDTGATVMLAAGSGARFAPGEAPRLLRFVPDPMPEQADAWLRADGDRLDLVAARLQRYAAAPVTVDPSVAPLPVGGRFRLDDVDGTLRLIARGNGLRVTRSAGGWRIGR